MGGEGNGPSRTTIARTGEPGGDRGLRGRGDPGKATGVPEPAPEAAGPAGLEAKYRKFFGELAREGEPVELGDLGDVVSRSLAREGYVARETEVGEVLDLIQEMVGGRGEGDTIVVRFRVRGRDIEGFKVGR